MQSRGRFLILFLIVVAAVVAALLWFRRDTQAAFGPAWAICPGPDQYGYTCTGGGGYAYVDATQDTFLYQDDGLVELELPFPFTFYGTTYTSLQASSNGTLHFGGGTAVYLNSCLTDGPAPGLADMIAPYWDDLDLTYSGYLETAVVGTAPDRIFVVEWDEVPPFGSDYTDTVTFEVQLFEATQDVVVLYQDVSLLLGSRGGSATVGLQSEAQGLTLQFSCDQPMLADGTGLRFVFPATPNAEVGQETAVLFAPMTTDILQAKGRAVDLLDSLAVGRPAAMSTLAQQWRRQIPPRHLEWVTTDLDGNGRNDLIAFWWLLNQPLAGVELAVVTLDETNGPQLWLQQALSTREQVITGVTAVDTADVTGDHQPDILLQATENGRLFVVTAALGRTAVFALPGRCTAVPHLQDITNDGVLDIVQTGCGLDLRLIQFWNGQKFIPHQ